MKIFFKNISYNLIFNINIAICAAQAKNEKKFKTGQKLKSNLIFNLKDTVKPA